MSFRKMSLDGLKLGEIYFIVVFDDEDLSIPIIQTLRYIGELSDDSESINVYFSLFGHSDEESTIFVRKDNVPDLVLDRTQLLRFLELGFSGELSRSPDLKLSPGSL